MKMGLLGLFVMLAVTGCGGTHNGSFSTGAMANATPPMVSTNAAVANIEADAEISRNIRMAIAADPDFSTEARNLYIRTVNGQTEFRGAIASDFERARVQDIATKYAGVNHVCGITTIVPDAVATAFERDPIRVTALKQSEGFE